MTTTAFPKTCATLTAQSFAQENFGTVQLGHRARNQALLRLAENLCRHPGGTLPNKLACPADYQSMCRLANRAEVTHERVLAPHYQRTRTRMEQTTGVVLVLHDTTELDYSGLDSIAALGPIGNGGCRGYLCHNSLAVALDQKEVLGLVQQILHTRQPVPIGEGLRAKRERTTRESRLWSRAVTALGATPPERTWIDVADRGADVFEFLATEQRLHRRCLVRACHNRAIQLGHDGDGARGLLFDHLRTLPAQDQRVQTVYDAHGPQPAREATLAVAAAAVRLQPPHQRRGESQRTVVGVGGAGLGVAATSGMQGSRVVLAIVEAVQGVAEAWERSDWYGCRPLIEEYHKAMKTTGCHIEEMQFTTAAALQPMIGLQAVVAVLLFQLRQASRRPDAPTRPATEAVAPVYEEVLRHWRYKKSARRADRA